MKMSEIDIAVAATYLKQDLAELSAQEKIELNTFIEAAKTYISDYTGQSRQECDKIDTFFVAALILVQDMFDNRSRYLQGSQATPSKLLDDILGMHSINLL